MEGKERVFQAVGRRRYLRIPEIDASRKVAPVQESAYDLQFGGQIALSL